MPGGAGTGTRYNGPGIVMRDLNDDLRRTFLIVVGVLVCLAVVTGLMLYRERAVRQASPGPWHALPPDSVEQPAAKPAGPAK